MTRQDLGSSPSRPNDVVTVAWTNLLLDTFRPIPQVGSIVTATALTINTDLYDAFNITALASGVVITASGAPVDHQKLMVRVKDTGIAQILSWGSMFTDSGVAKLLVTTVPGKTHHVGLIYDAQTSVWICLAVDTLGATI